MSQAEPGKNKPKRRFKRVPQHMAVGVRINDTGHAGRSTQVRGVATDLGPGGMQLLMGSAHQVGTYLNIEIMLDGKPHTVGGIVRHLRWVSGTPGMMFGHGVEIVEVSESTMRAIVTHLTAFISRRPAYLPKAA